jgi:excisionase family DNA binding protein
MQTSTTPRYLTLTEAAALLRVSRSKVLAWLRSGRLRGSDVSANPSSGKARWRIARADLDAFLEGRVPQVETKPSRRRKPTRPSGWVAYF